MKSLAKSNANNTQTSAISQFRFESHEVRVISINDEPWFVAADLCRALDLANPTKAIMNLDDDEKALTSIQGLSRGNEEANIVSESGMYTLVLRCRDAIKPGTVPYRVRKWVTGEVLPSIRKSGSYETQRKVKKIAAGKITADQQEAIKQLVMSRGKALPKEKQAKAMITMWSSLKSHFGCSYKEIVEEQFTEALSLAARVPLEGEFLGKQEALPAPALTLNYGMDWFDQYRWIIGSAALDAPWRYPAEMLNPNGDYPNPIGRMLVELKGAGQQVDAAMFQLQALQHHLWVCRQKISRASLTLQ